MERIDDDLKAFLQSDLGTFVGASDPVRGPQVSRGWGLRVLDDRGTAEVFVDRDAGAGVTAAVKADGRVAVVTAQPTTYRSIQLKGRCIEVGEPARDDAEWVQGHRDRYAASVALLGQPPAATRNEWTYAITRIRFTIDETFDQTPGPDAGGRL